MKAYGITEVFVKHDYYSELKIKYIKKEGGKTFLFKDLGDRLEKVRPYKTQKKLYPVYDKFLGFEIDGIENYFYIYEDGEHSYYRYKYIKHIGSSRSSKSWSIEEKAIRVCETISNSRVTVWRDTRESLGNSVWKDFRKIFPLSGRKYKFPKNTVPIYFANGSMIEPHGDDTTNAHGITQDIAWLNEPYKMSKDTFDQIDQRANQIWIDINPSGKHWSDDLDKHPRCKVIHSTFDLNPFCPIEQKKKILSYDPNNLINVANKTSDAYMWSVYGLGMKAEKPNRIFKGWTKIQDRLFDILPYPSYFGLDFGLSAPSALVEMKFDGDRTFFLKERLYSPMNKLPGTLSEEFERLGISKEIEIICDSGNEINKNEGNKLRNAGYDVIFAKKGSGSISAGIETMQKAAICYTEGSENIENEYESYSWKMWQGIQMDVPEDHGDDHILDAAKYSIVWYVKTRGLSI
jgi:PBSX family phage terminase large subunit